MKYLPEHSVTSTNVIHTGDALTVLRTMPDNLMLLCIDCHHWIHSRDNLNSEYLEDFNVDDPAGG